MMNCTPMQRAIKPIIRVSAVIPVLPSTLTILSDRKRTVNVAMLTRMMATVRAR